MLILKRILQNQCQEGSVFINGNCSTCSSMNKFYLMNNKTPSCIDKCPNQYQILNYTNSCYNCPNGTFYNMGTCIETCPNSSKIENNSCIHCWMKNKVYVKNQNDCYTRCPLDSMKTSDKQCLKCSDSKLYYYNYSCYDKMPNNTFIIDYINNITDTCQNQYKYQWGPNCDEECQWGYYKNVSTLTCIKCRSYNLYVSQFKCVNNCSGNYSRTYLCQDCFSLSQFSSPPNKSTCYATCPINTLVDYYNYKCIINLQGYKKNNIEYCKEINTPCNGRGICKIINTNYFICDCNNGYSGNSCQNNQSEIIMISNFVCNINI